ncbi:MAG: D-Ala-D-Ala carboxypeptidase family metallohydrolase [Cyanobacteria bacterium P01_C01_bin.72]
MKLPSETLVYPSTPIYPGSNFTWGEATEDCKRSLENLYIDGRLIITAAQIEQNIISVARNLDAYREKLDNRPIIINSWYRPRAVNRNNGGVKWSRHQYGDGVDWVSGYFSPQDAARILEPDHNDGGYKAYSNFTHTDWRGHKARW